MSLGCHEHGVCASKRTVACVYCISTLTSSLRQQNIFSRVSLTAGEDEAIPESESPRLWNGITARRKMAPACAVGIVRGNVYAKSSSSSVAEKLSCA